MPRSSPERVAAVSGVATVVASVGGIAAAVALAPWFSPTANALSDLGVAESAAVAAAFNGGLLLAGALALPYGWALWETAADRTGRLRSLLFWVAVVLLGGVGAFPSGTSPHVPVALGFYLLLTLVLTVDGLDRRATTVGRFSLLAAGVHIAQWWLWIAGVRLGPGLAIPELVGAALFAAWTLAGSPVAPWRSLVARELD